MTCPIQQPKDLMLHQCIDLRHAAQRYWSSLHVSPRDILTPLRSVAMNQAHNVARQPGVTNSILALVQSTVGSGQHAATPRSESKRDSSKELSEICRCAKSLLRVTRLSTKKVVY